MNSSRLQRLGLTVGSLLALSTSIAGCASTGSAPQPTAAQASSSGAASGVGQGTNGTNMSARLTLPIEGYLISRADNDVMLRANGMLIRSCMARFGFDYTPPQFTTAAGQGNDDAANMGRRYGLADMSVASTYGYHLPPRPNAGSAAAAPAPMSDAENLVFIGDSPGSGNTSASLRYHGLQIPSHGCSGEAQRKMGTGMNEHFAESLDDMSFHQSQSDPTVVAAIKKWSTCMGGKGYTFDVPWQPNPDSGPSASKSEIQMAEADVSCKQKTDLITTWFAAESSIQRTMIAKNEEALTQLKQQETNTLKYATSLVAQ